MSDIEHARRFVRRRTDGEGSSAGTDSLAELHSELVLLREENARLKAAEHAGPDIDGLLARARSLSEATIEHSASEEDEATGVLVEALAIRESLLEICRHIERTMTVFEKRLRALPGAGEEAPPQPVRDARIGHWFEPPPPVRADEQDSDGPRRA